MMAVAGEVPRGLKPVPQPDENPTTEATVAIGKQLYFDKRLSQDSTVSCASCHDPAKGWSNADAFATGVDGARGGRSAPTVINTAYNTFHFWDGRAGSLEEQALGPVQNPIEMAMTLEDVEERLNTNLYVASFGTADEGAKQEPGTVHRIAAGQLNKAG